MWRDAALVAGKDLRLELRSRVTTNQVLPFALLVLLLFGFALDADRPVLDRATPGLFWLAVLFSTLLAVQRSFAVEAADGNRDALRLSGLSPAGGDPRQGPRRRRPAPRPRGGAAVGVAVLYGTASTGPGSCWPPASSPRSGWPPPAASTARSPPGCGCATPAAAAPAPGARPGAHRRHPGLRGRPRHGWCRRVGVGQPLAVFAAVYVGLALVLRVRPPGGRG